MIEICVIPTLTHVLLCIMFATAVVHPPCHVNGSTILISLPPRWTNQIARMSVQKYILRVGYR